MSEWPTLLGIAAAALSVIAAGGAIARRVVRWSRAIGQRIADLEAALRVRQEATVQLDGLYVLADGSGKLVKVAQGARVTILGVDGVVCRVRLENATTEVLVPAAALKPD